MIETDDEKIDNDGEKFETDDEKNDTDDETIEEEAGEDYNDSEESGDKGYGSECSISSFIYIAGGVTNNRRCPQNPAPWIHVKREHGRGTNARNMVKSAR